MLRCSTATRLEADTDFGEFVAPLHQLAVLTVLMPVLRTKHDIPNVYFQDPNFQPVAIQFLESLGYTVLDDPEAFDMMSPSTFLFAPYCPEDVNYRALESSFPALYIGNDPRLVTWSILNRQSGLKRMRGRRIYTFFHFGVSTKEGEAMMPVLDEEDWVANAQIRWLNLDYKKFERGFPVVLFFLFRVLVFLLLTWKRMRLRSQSFF